MTDLISILHPDGESWTEWPFEIFSGSAVTQGHPNFALLRNKSLV